MTDSKPLKPTIPSVSSGLAKTTSNTTLDTNRQGVGIKLPGLHARLRNPKNELGVVDATKCTNRLALMLDVSGSMDGQKIASLRDAVTGFISACDFTDTSIAMEPFGDDYPSSNRVVQTTLAPMLMTTAMMLQAEGCTPMARAMDYVLNTYSITRGVLVSDGEPDSVSACYDSAAQYREAGIMIDCVHIGDSSSGEACLRRIAEITGGQYIKFTDVSSFSKSFKYLTPKFYAMLTSGSVTASDIGAKELK